MYAAADKEEKDREAGHKADVLYGLRLNPIVHRIRRCGTARPNWFDV